MKTENTGRHDSKIITRCVAVAMSALFIAGSLSGCDTDKNDKSSDDTKPVILTDSKGEAFKTPDGEDIVLDPLPAVKAPNIVDGVFVPRSDICEDVLLSDKYQEAIALGEAPTRPQLNTIGAGMCVPEYYAKEKNFTEHNALYNTGVKSIFYTNDTLYMWAYCNSRVSDYDPNFANFSLLEYDVGEDVVSDLVYLLDDLNRGGANLLVQEISRKYIPKILGEQYLDHGARNGTTCTMLEKPQYGIVKKCAVESRPKIKYFCHCFVFTPF